MHITHRQAGSRNEAVSPRNPELDFSDESIQRLVAHKGWSELSDFEKVKGFCGYGVAVRDFQHPPVDFNRNNTYIQSEGITSDFGVYDSPDELLREHG